MGAKDQMRVISYVRDMSATTDKFSSFDRLIRDVKNKLGLGDFWELEVVLRPEQSVEAGKLVAADLMSQLRIEHTDLIDKSYVDLISSSIGDCPRSVVGPVLR